MMMMSGGGSLDSEATLTNQSSVPMVMRADGSGSPAPLSLYPPGFDLSSFLILDPLSDEWLSGAGFSTSDFGSMSASDIDPTTGGGRY